jgi:hypothetical protein
MGCNMSRMFGGRLLAVCATVALFGGFAPWAHAVPAAETATTSTTLSIYSGSQTTTSVPSGTVVTFVAAVSAGAGKVTTGQVSFFDATGSFSTEPRLVGTAQLTSAGTATIAFRPTWGTRTYKAVFAGTTTNAGSTSATASLAVTGGMVTTTTIAQSGSQGNYTLTGTVTGVLDVPFDAGIYFINTTDDNAVIAREGGIATALSNSFVNPAVITSATTDGETITSIALGDIDGDGHLDLVAGNSSPVAGGVSLTVMQGTYGPNFLSEPPTPPVVSPAALALADFNGDGKLDIAVASKDTNTVAVLLGNGLGGFPNAPSSAATGLTPRSLAIGDFNGDGKPDIAAANYNDHTVTILIGNGDGTFTATPASPETASGPLSIVAGDFNGDGKIDLAVGGATLTVLLGNGDGTFTPTAASTQKAMGTENIVAGDFNEDGKLDLALANGPTTVTLLLGNGDGTFTASTIDTGLDPEIGNTIATLQAGDFDGEGHQDLAFFDYVSDDPGSIRVGVLHGDGTGKFTAPDPNTGYTSFNATSPTGFAVGDVNGDGIPDLAVINGSPGTSQVSTVIAATQSETSIVTGVAMTPGSGTNLVEASFQGSNEWQSSTSATTALTGGPGSSNVALTASAQTIAQGASLTLTATITGSVATPTGSVTFKDAFGQLGTGTLNSSGVATFSTSALTAGSYSITAAYGGDANNSPSTSAALALTVTGPPATVSIPTPAAVSAGSTAAATATFTASSSYAGTLNLACSLTKSPTGAQSLPACSLNPASLALKAGATGTTALSVTTTAASTTALSAVPSRKSLLLMGGIPARRRRWLSMVILLWVVVASAAIGCGGGGGAKGMTTPATTSGNYTFTVTGTDSKDATITTSATVVVTVQ